MPSFRKYCISSFVVHIVVFFAILIMPDFAKKSYTFPDGYKVKMVNLPKGSSMSASGPAKQKVSTPKEVKKAVKSVKQVAPPSEVVSKSAQNNASALLESNEKEVVKKVVLPEKEEPVPVESSSGFEEVTEEVGNVDGVQKSDGILGMESGDVGVVAHLDTEDFEYLWYLENIKRKISSNWVKPSLPGKKEGANVVVYFKILSDGKINDATIEESSGISSVDRSCLRSVIASSPLPALPRGFPESVLGVHFRFIL